MKLYLTTFGKDGQGQDLVEYALTVGIMAVAAVAAMPQLTNTINNIFSRIASVLASAVT